MFSFLQFIAKYTQFKLKNVFLPLNKFKCKNVLQYVMNDASTYFDRTHLKI